MFALTVSVPDEDLAFFRAYSATEGILAEALREHLERPVRTEVAAATGIISPDVAGEDANDRHLDQKHQ